MHKHTRIIKNTTKDADMLARVEGRIKRNHLTIIPRWQLKAGALFHIVGVIGMLIFVVHSLRYEVTPSSTFNDNDITVHSESTELQADTTYLEPSRRAESILGGPEATHDSNHSQRWNIISFALLTLNTSMYSRRFYVLNRKYRRYMKSLYIGSALTTLLCVILYTL